MLALASALSTDYKQVRVDLYEINGEIYFGEMTFTSASGLGQIKPDEYNEILGSYWKI